MRSHEQLYIGGKWVAPSGRGSVDVIDAATEEPVGRIPDGNEEDVDRAVKAASAALPGWAATPPAERARFLDRIKEGLAARAEEIATTISAEVGSPITMAKAVQAALPVTVTGSFAALAREFPFEERIGNSLVVREPVGVVAAITPWNYPLHQAMGKVAPALAAGCTVVLKPSEVAPLSAFILAEIVHQAGLPAGVFNLITGNGPPFGEMLVRHPRVDMISLTGSTRAGRRVAELAAPSVKRVALELGGKSATVILEDADFDKAVGVSVSNAFLNGGQTCSAWTRMLVPRKRQDQALEIAKRSAAKFKPGDPRSAETRLGPLASAQQRERVRKYIRTGIEEGAEVVVGGPDAPEGLPKGYYVKPTIFAGVKPEMTIAREEIFGPVISVLAYEDEDDAVRIANDTIYGLAGGVWSADASRAERIARRLRTGQVDINGGRFNPLAPFGGFKQSGRGRELGKFGLEEFVETKSMQF
ncbi:MAG: aldehyde dehydrogenase family protein [Deltaproteobacteria bacterium]|nr:MAG: aldehyde dehydrogenase family protein [Deltaproteobacteria bacterium]